MYENISFEEILNRMLARIPDSFDKREGSIIYDALAPAAVELKQIYIELDTIMAETFADTASRENLIKRAAERGITPKPATYATVIGSFNPPLLDIPVGSRFSCEDLNFVVREKIKNGEYYLQCEEAGSAGNISSGSLLMIDNINGLISGMITGVSIYGEDEEETETFRNRYFESLQADAFGGNKLDYKSKALSQTGVGGVKVYGAQQWNGGGTVKLVILSSNFDAPSENLINQLQTTIDPVENMGEGNGIAPIGHIVTVVPVDTTTVNITLDITYLDDYNWSLIEKDVKAAIDGYFLELNQTWQDLDNIIVRIAQIESRILAIRGVQDVRNGMINGRAENLQVDKDAIVVRGTINGNE